MEEYRDSITHYIKIYLLGMLAFAVPMLLTFFVSKWFLIVAFIGMGYIHYYHVRKPRKCLECKSLTSPIKETETFFYYPSEHKCDACGKKYKIESTAYW